MMNQVLPWFKFTKVIMDNYTCGSPQSNNFIKNQEQGPNATGKNYFLLNKTCYNPKILEDDPLDSLDDKSLKLNEGDGTTVWGIFTSYPDSGFNITKPVNMA